MLLVILQRPRSSVPLDLPSGKMAGDKRVESIPDRYTSTPPTETGRLLKGPAHALTLFSATGASSIKSGVASKFCR